MIGTEDGPSLNLLFERYGPLGVSIAAFVANTWWFRFALLDHGDWANRLLDRTIQATSVGVAFWGVAITLFLGMDAKPVLLRLKELGYFKFIVRYFSEALFAALTLLLISVLFEPLWQITSRVALSSTWVAIGFWALTTTVRSFSILTKMLVRIE